MRNFILCVLLLLVALKVMPQPVKVTGLVKSPGGEPVPYATLNDTAAVRGAVCNVEGYFTLNVEQGNHVFKVSHVAYSPVFYSIHVARDTFMVFTLGGRQIEEVVIKGTSLANQAMLGSNFLEGKTIRNIPTFFGEQDILKAITVLPGISGGLDLYSSIFVRGGNRDQNLFLVDGARFYTTSHAGGYASLFNPDMIKHIDVYKGGAPVRYGDGISSVIDVSLREGGDEGTKLNLDIGTMRSGFLTEGKIGRKVSFIAGGRFSYWDLINGNLFKEKNAEKDNSANTEYSRFDFWDVDGKITFTPTARTTVTLYGHLGEDEKSSFWKGNTVTDEYGEIRKIDKGGSYISNNTATLSAKQLFKNWLSLKNTLWYTFYNLSDKSSTAYLLNTKTIRDYHSYVTYIKDLSDKVETYFPVGERHMVNAGVQLSSFTVNPGKISQQREAVSVDTTFGASDQHATEMSVFIDDDFNIASKVWLRLGVRLSDLIATDTSYLMVEPRITLRIQARKKLSVKAGFSLTNQPFHTIVNANSYFEQESWLLANKTYRPQLARQYAAGIYGTIPGTIIEFSAEAYYKAMENLLYYAPPNYENDNLLAFVQKGGQGIAYGGELLLQKTTGTIQWSVAYTLAWSKRKLNNLNSGQWFFADFDRRHDFNLGFHYFKNIKNTWNCNYIFQTGRAYTLPEAYVNATGFYQGYYVSGGVNNARTPNYSRFDVSYKRKLFKRRKAELTLSVMNLFAHKNPFAVYPKDGKMYMSSWYLMMPSAQLKIYLLKD
ncbi:MAG TPA: TonB-dependent receptor plug domain-containing protein [Prolixibacteraceae bacterium]|nr:TonB-dependent receptor plug domain-containing protein [Prolixibacteraceae bacterium]